MSDVVASSLVSGLLWVVMAWSVLLLAGAAFGPGLGPDAAAAIGFGALAVLLVAARPRARRRGRGRGLGALLLGIVAGFASYPAWVLAIAAIGASLELSPPAPRAPYTGEPLAWISLLLLSPVFEELLYRERLLAALERPLGALPAVALSSALFALPHLDPWPVLTTCAVGLALGGLMRLARSVAPCIGVHAGLNLAALLCGAPPVQRAPAAAVGAALALGATLLAVGLCRWQRPPAPERSRHRRSPGWIVASKETSHG